MTRAFGGFGGSMRLVFVTGSLVAAIGFATGARAEPTWYVSGSGGGFFRDDYRGSATFFRENDPSSTVAASLKTTFDPGSIATIAAGYRLSPRIRVEIELGYLDYTGSAEYPSANNPSFPRLNGQKFSHLSGDELSDVTGTLNGFYDFPTVAGRLTPYLGGGVGAAASRRASGEFVASDGTPLTSNRQSSPQGLGLFEAGLNIQIGPHLSVVPAYRYIQFFRANRGGGDIAKIGLRYQF